MVVSIEQQDDGTWNRVYKRKSTVHKDLLILDKKFLCTKEGYLFDKDNNPIIPRRHAGDDYKNRPYKRIAPYKSGWTRIIRNPRKKYPQRAYGFKRGPYKVTRERLERERLAKINNDKDNDSS